MKHCFNSENSFPIIEIVFLFIIILIIYISSDFTVTQSEKKWLFVHGGIRLLLSFSENHHFLNNVWLFPVSFWNNVASTEIRFSTSDGASTTVLFPSPFFIFWVELPLVFRVTEINSSRELLFYFRRSTNTKIKKTGRRNWIKQKFCYSCTHVDISKLYI